MQRNYFGTTNASKKLPIDSVGVQNMYTILHRDPNSMYLHIYHYTLALWRSLRILQHFLDPVFGHHGIRIYEE